jgi:hypothetical protein
MRIIGIGDKERQNEKPKVKAKAPHVKPTCGAPPVVCLLRLVEFFDFARCRFEFLPENL